MGLAFLALTVFNYTSTKNENSKQIEYSQFMVDVNAGKVSNVTMEGSVVGGYVIKGKRTDNTEFFTNAPLDDKLVPTLLEKKVRLDVKPEEKPSMLLSIFISLLPVLLLIGLWVFFMRQMQGGGKNGAMSFGKSKARLLDKDKNSITFKDVAGCDEAKEEVSEIVDYLKAPSRYQSLGGRLPRGVLLCGSPGTGKTLLAKAIAGEAKVPFFSISGSDFVEMFVGVGASRVRDMFEQAKKNAPCIIFIDEIDAVGRQRGAGLGGGNDEREQTLNQLLVEMDGFNNNETVIVIAATNRPDVLDPALMRPGRFDRQVVVPLPDIRGREHILQVHARKVPIDKEVNLATIARGTPGFSGADLANLINEAALFAARRNKRLVDQSDFESAKDKIIMGAERRSMVMTEDEKRNTAYHESGHAIVAKLIPGSDPVHKVTIIPRGRALGVTMQLPEEDRYAYDRKYLLGRIAILFGGRIAEEVFMNQMTTGASNDFERATQMARDMVTRYGMSDKMGPMVYGENESEVFLGRSVTTTKNLSETTLAAVDAEIRRIIDEQYKLARTLLEENRDKVERMTKALLDWETIDSDQIDEIMAGKEPSPPKDYSQNVRTEEELAALDEIDQSKQTAVKEPTDGNAPEEPKTDSPVEQEPKAEDTKVEQVVDNHTEATEGVDTDQTEQKKPEDK
ncbi:ATP-dependent zinc metalloprotease FtsH [Neisseria sp. Ec49-e6-T10]|uniref:ATP-dependent zinc metalloprotease FtsH n=1 Tax=Neisseria sp. Ec49-e6-T10 TaxID=3140744 RepID=UPI003EBF44F1